MKSIVPTLIEFYNWIRRSTEAQRDINFNDRATLNRSGYLRLHCVEGYVARHLDPPEQRGLSSPLASILGEREPR